MKLVSIAERKQFRICKMQKHKITKMQKGAKSIFLIDKRKRTAYILQRKIEEGESVHRAALAQHSPSAMGKQKKWPPITAAIYPMFRALASISGDDKIFRIIDRQKIR